MGALRDLTVGRATVEPVAASVSGLSDVTDHRSALLAHELLEVPRTARELPGRSGVLPAAERLGIDERTGRRALLAVHVAHPGLDPVEPRVDLVFVLGEEAGTESVLAVVGLRDSLFEARDGVDSDEREEVLVRRERVIVRNIRDHGGLDVPTGREVGSIDAAPTGQDRAVRGRRFTDIVIALDRAVVDQGRDDRLPVLGLADGEVVRFLDESLRELVGDILVDVHAGGRGALLTAERERAKLHAGDRLRDIGAVGDDDRVFPAELRDDWPAFVQLIEGPLDLESDLARAREHESGDVLVFDHRLADRAPAARDQVDDAVRNARLREGVVEGMRRQRRGARRFHQRGVSGDQRAGRHSDGDREREIERGHNAIDAGAENIHVHVEENGDHIRIYVEDDGRGIAKTIEHDGTPYDGIRFALAFGDRYDQGSVQIGKFGWGLPASATCTSLRTEVYTRQEDDKEWRYSYVDLEEMDDENDTKTPISKEKSPEHLDLENPSPDSGTVVSFEKCDDTDPKTVRGIVGRLTRNLPRVYRYFLDGDIDISVNGTELEPTDPLFMMENAHNVGELPEKVPQVEETFHKKTIHLEEKDGDDEYPVTVTVVMLDVEAIRKCDEWGPGWMSDHGLVEGNQGFSIVRNGREIRHGLTLGLFKRHADKNYMRAQIEFPPELDDKFGIQTDKSRLRLKQAVKDKIDDALDNAPQHVHKKTRETIRKLQAEANKEQEEAEPSPSERAAEKAAQFMKSPRDQTEEELKEVAQKLEEEKQKAIKNVENDPDLDEEEKEEVIERKEKKYERQKNPNSYNVTTDTLGSGHFYKADFQGNQVNAIINDGHKFYEVYQQLRTGAHRDAEEAAPDGGIEETLSGQTEESVLIDHLLLAAARAELMMQDRYDDKAQEYIYQFRSEWSEALRGFAKYMEDGMDEAVLNLDN